MPDAAFDVNRTQQTVERINRHRSIGAARRHGHAGTHPDDGLGCGLAHGTGHAHDLRRRYQRLLFTPDRRAVLEFEVPPFHQTVSLFLDEGCRVNRLTGDKQILAVLEVTDKLAVPQSFCQKHMRNGTGQRTVGAGTDRKPLMRLGGNIGQTRVHCDHGATLHDGRELVHHVGHHAIRCQRVRTPQHQAIGVGQIVVTVAKETLRQTRAHFFGFGADRAVRKIVASAKDLGQRAIKQFRRCGRIATAHIDQLVRFLGLAQFDHSVSHCVECLVPADRHKLRIDATPFEWIGPLHRHLDAVRVVHLLRNHVSARAAITVVGLGQWITAHPRGPTRLHEDLDRTPLCATLTGTGNPVTRGRTAGLGLARHQRAVQRRCRQHGAAGDQ